MPKLSDIKRRPLHTDMTAPIATTGPRLRTDEGGGAVLCDPASELFMLAMTIVVGEDTYYERADERDARFVEVSLAEYLRESMLMRSVPWPTSPR